MVPKHFYSNRGFLPGDHLTKDPIHKTKSGTDLVELGALMAQLI